LAAYASHFLFTEIAHTYLTRNLKQFLNVMLSNTFLKPLTTHY